MWAVELSKKAVANRNKPAVHNSDWIYKEGRGCEIDYVKARIAKETRTAEARRSLSVSYVKMGEISENERQLSKAKEYYQQALEPFNYLAQETKEVLAQRDLAVCCNKLGNIYKVMGQLLEAKECYLHSVELSCQMLKTAETVGNNDNLAISLYNLGTVDEKEVEQEVLTRALVIWDALAK